MKILYSSYHIIDLENEVVEAKALKGDMPGVIEKIMKEIASNPSAKKYGPTSDRTLVVNTINELMNMYNSENMDKNEFCIYAGEISEKLLREEIKIQQKVGHLKGVQKGCLVQSLIETGEQNYLYFIAKIEHAEFVDGIELILKEGFNPNENKVWKTCIFDFEVDDDICVSKANVYVNHKARYWADCFLELKELKSDETNTKEAWAGIQTELNRSIRKKYPNDYFILRNAVISYFRRSRTVVYDDMIEDIFCEYEPMNASNEEILSLYNKLLNLPKAKGFDTNFISRPKEIRANIKSVHRVNKDIEVVIREGISENVEKYKDVIYSKTDADGQMKLVIRITDDETFKMFKIR